MFSQFFENPDLEKENTEKDSQSNLEQFLRISLVPDTKMMLSLAQVTEVLKIPVEKIVPIPQMPPWTMGVYNWRGEILWIVDLGHLVGLTPWYQQNYAKSNHQAVVIHSGTKNTGQKLGLVVNQAEDIELCNPDLIESPPASSISMELAPFLRGYWIKKNGGIIVVIDPETIMAAMPKP